MLNLLRRSTAQSKTLIETKPCNDTANKQYITRACVFELTDIVIIFLLPLLHEDSGLCVWK